MRLVCLLLGLVVIVAGCATSSDPQHDMASICRFESDHGVLHLSGPTDQAMAECIAELADAGVRTIRINSGGGNVERALDAAEVIADWRAHIIVDEACNSSCANYFLPVARRVTLSPRAMVLLHGSIDQGFVEQLADPDQRIEAQATADRQATFAARHDIPAGWLLIRTREDYDARRGLGPALEGDLMPAGPFFTRMRFLMVDETFFRSCLAHVELDRYSATEADRARDRWWVRWAYAQQGVFLSGDMQCVAP